MSNKPQEKTTLQVPTERSWHVDSTAYKNHTQTQTCEFISASDKDKQKVVGYYQPHPMPGYEIGAVHVINNPTLEAKFVLQLKTLQEKASSPAFAPTWSRMSNPEVRQETHELFVEITNPHTDPDYSQVKLVPTWHGTRKSNLDSIGRIGFANLATTDSGFFGKGLYSTCEANYAFRVYGKDEQEGVLIVTWVAIYSALPVNNEDMPLLTGRANYGNYDAHFIPVSGTDGINYYPCRAKQRHYTELTTFESGSSFPRYVVELQKTLLRAPAMIPSPTTSAMINTTATLPPLPVLIPERQRTRLPVLDDLSKPLTIEQVQSLILSQEQEDALKDWLFSFVQASKTDASQAKNAAIAITTLNALRVAFMGKFGDLSNSKISGADLWGGIFPCTSFQGADLRNVNFTGAYLGETNFSGANLTDAEFGALPNLSTALEFVHCVCHSPDGRYFAVAAGDAIRLYSIDNEKYEYLASLEGHTDAVMSISFSFDSKYLASGSKDSVIILWDVSRRKRVIDLQGHRGAVSCVSFSPSGQWLVSGSHDKNIILWDAKSQQRLMQFKEISVVHSVAFSHNSKWFAAGKEDGIVTLWDVIDKKPLAVLRVGKKPVHSVAVSPNDQWLASASEKSIELWAVSTQMFAASLQGHDAPIQSVSFSADGKWLASASEDETIGLWDVEKRKLLANLQGHKNSVWSVSFSPNSNWLASGSRDKTIGLWNVNQQKRLTNVRGDSQSFWSVSFSPNGQWLAFGSHNSTISLWDISKQKQCASFQGPTSPISALSFSRDNKWLVTAHMDGSISLWDINTQSCFVSFRGHQGVVSGVCFSLAASGIFMSGSWDRTVRFWDIKTVKNAKTLSPESAITIQHTSRISSIAGSANSNWLAYGDDKSTITLVNIFKNGERLKLPQKHTKEVCCVVFSADSKLLASGSWDRTICLWDIPKQEHLATLQGHADCVLSISFSPDGQWLASASKDHTIGIWDIQKKERLASLQGHTKWVTSVSFSPDSQWLASDSVDHSVCLWKRVVGALTETWVIVERIVTAFPLVAPNAYLGGAIISNDNLKLLEQRGATSKLPAYNQNPHVLWAQEQQQATAATNTATSTASVSPKNV